jgi:hypothetical protein
MILKNMALSTYRHIYNVCVCVSVLRRRSIQISATAKLMACSIYLQYHLSISNNFHWSTQSNMFNGLHRKMGNEVRKVK